MSYWLEERTELRAQDLKILSCTFILTDEWPLLRKVDGRAGSCPVPAHMEVDGSLVTLNALYHPASTWDGSVSLLLDTHY